MKGFFPKTFDLEMLKRKNCTLKNRGPCKVSRLVKPSRKRFELTSEVSQLFKRPKISLETLFSQGLNINEDSNQDPAQDETRDKTQQDEKEVETTKENQDDAYVQRFTEALTSMLKYSPFGKQKLTQYLDQQHSEMERKFNEKDNVLDFVISHNEGLKKSMRQIDNLQRVLNGMVFELNNSSQLCEEIERQILAKEC